MLSTDLKELLYEQFRANCLKSKKQLEEFLFGIQVILFNLDLVVIETQDISECNMFKSSSDMYKVCHDRDKVKFFL